MKLVLLVLLTLSTIFCHSQTLQIINNDTVVVLSKKQADDINDRFKALTISKLELHRDLEQKKISEQKLLQLNAMLEKEKDSIRISSLKYVDLYYDSQKILLNREQYYHKQTKLHLFTFLALSAATAIFAFL